MNFLRTLRFRIRALLDRRRMDDEIAEELAFHIDEHTAALVARGVPESEARRHALVRFGGTTRLAEETRAAQGFAPIDAVAQHVRYAARGIRRSPMFATVVAVTLGLGIGANGALFGIIDRLLLRGPEGVVAPNELWRAYVHTRAAGGGEQTTAIEPYAFYALLRSDTALFAAAGGYTDFDLRVGHGADSHTIPAVAATWDLFRTLGVRPYLGRFFDATEDQPPTGARVVVLGFGYWQRELGGDSTVLGREIALGDRRLTVIGIAPPHFTGAERKAVDVWIPMSTRDGPAPTWPTTWNATWVQFVGRVRPDISRRAAEARATALLRAGYTGNDPEMRGASVLLRPILYDEHATEPPEIGVTKLLYGVAILVLLIGAANVANLLIARAIRRQREVAVRVALGAGRLRLATMMLTESLALASLGGVAGLAMGYGAGTLIRQTLLPSVAWDSSPVDLPVLVYTAIAVLGTAVLIGVAPSLRATRGDPILMLKSGIPQAGERRNYLRSALQVAQVALSVVLLFTAGLFVRSLWRVRGLDLGLDPAAVVTADIAFDEPDDRTGEGFQRAVIMNRLRSRQLLEEVRHLPSVVNASLAIGTPFYSAYGVGVAVPGRDSLPAAKGGGPYINAVAPDYFETVGTHLLRGRTFTAADHEGSEPVVIVNETMARTIWPNENPLTKCLIVADSKECARVVGVVADARKWSIREDPAMQFYIPYGQERGIAGWMLLVRPNANVDRFAGELRSALARFAPDARLIEVHTLASVIDPQIRPWRVGALMFGVFGVLALVVAAVGLFSVVSYLVAQRTHELGVRIALGAGSRRITQLVLGGAFRAAATGIGLGIVGALAIGPAVQSLLFDTSPRDPAVLAVVAVTMLLTALVAGILPSLRACRVDPVVALRSD